MHLKVICWCIKTSRTRCILHDYIWYDKGAPYTQDGGLLLEKWKDSICSTLKVTAFGESIQKERFYRDFILILFDIYLWVSTRKDYLWKFESYFMASTGLYHISKSSIFLSAFDRNFCRPCSLIEATHEKVCRQ